MSSITTESRTLAPWISAIEAAEILGVPQAVIEKLAQERRITSRSVPFSHTRFSRADVERLAEACTVPAISS